MVLPPITQSLKDSILISILINNVYLNLIFIANNKNVQGGGGGSYDAIHHFQQYFNYIVVRGSTLKNYCQVMQKTNTTTCINFQMITCSILSTQYNKIITCSILSTQYNNIILLSP